MFKQKPTTEQLAALLETPVDPDERIRARLRMELHRLVNHAALFGVEIPSPLPTEHDQIVACGGILPHRLRKRFKTTGSADPYGPLRQVHGGVMRGD